MEQLTLIKNNFEASYQPKDYILSKSNITVYQQLIIEEWQQHCIILYGAPGTGKTHLANIWKLNNNAIILKSNNTLDEKYQSYIIEDIENINDEVELLHYYNLTKENRCKLLLTTNTLPKSLPYKLPDIQSRLLAMPVLKLPENDEYLFKIILFKEFSARQIRVSAGVIHYILNHVERSVHRLIELVSMIDIASMKNKHNVTVPFVKKVNIRFFILIESELAYLKEKQVAMIFLIYLITTTIRINSLVY